MKKIIVGAVLLMGIAGAGMASAGCQYGAGQGQNMRKGALVSCGQQVNRDEMLRFRADNQEVLKKMAVQMSQQRALYRGENPDPLVAGKLAGQIFTLRDKVQAKALKAGLNNVPRGCFMGGSALGGAQLQGGGQVESDKVVAFNREHRKLRKDLAIKQGEKRALMLAKTPDLARVAAVSGDIFDLRASLQERAQQAGISAYLANCPRGQYGSQVGCRMGDGRRKGHGSMGGGRMGNGSGMYQ